jgi:hypothetical protein
MSTNKDGTSCVDALLLFCLRLFLCFGQGLEMPQFGSDDDDEDEDDGYVARPSSLVPSPSPRPPADADADADAGKLAFNKNEPGQQQIVAAGTGTTADTGPKETTI